MLFFFQTERNFFGCEEMKVKGNTYDEVKSFRFDEGYSSGWGHEHVNI